MYVKMSLCIGVGFGWECGGECACLTPYHLKMKD